jgi:hypothetical protein
MRYSVVSPEISTNGSENWPCIYTFEAKDDQDARDQFNVELKKCNTLYHRESRLRSGGAFWKHAILTQNGRKI